MQIGGDNLWFLYLSKCLLFLTLVMFMEQKYSFLCLCISLQFFATVDSTMANHLEVNRYYFKYDHGSVILFGTKNI